jgi:hypothetical protein
MKRITFRADERLIEEARLIAKSQHTTLSAAFREWLGRFASQAVDSSDFDESMQRLKQINSGRRFTRDEMNER